LFDHADLLRQKAMVFSLFKRKSSVPPELTFKARVERFWRWFEAEAPRIYAAIDAKQSHTLSDETTKKVRELGLHAWVFGPGANDVGHSLTVTGEGELHRQLLAIYWASRAPQIPGWTFYPARQPGKVKGITIKLGETNFDPMEFWLVPTVNVENKNIDVQVWHPLFGSMEDGQRYMILFLFLDEALGEYGTGRWIGRVAFELKRMGEAIPITEVKEFVERTREANGWGEVPLGESFSVYTFKEPHNHFRRGDIICISTMNSALFKDYLNAEGDLEDPLKGSGADYVYVEFDADWLPEGKEVAKRGDVEHALDVALKNAQSGRLMGGAWGVNSAYVDLMIFDGANSVEIVRRVLGEVGVPKGSSINYFAREKVGWRVVL
jgi:hypothetical protein